jgi:hypothetical protein
MLTVSRDWDMDIFGWQLFGLPNTKFENKISLTLFLKINEMEIGSINR